MQHCVYSVHAQKRVAVELAVVMLAQAAALLRCQKRITAADRTKKWGFVPAMNSFRAISVPEFKQYAVKPTKVFIQQLWICINIAVILGVLVVFGIIVESVV